MEKKKYPIVNLFLLKEKAEQIESFIWESTDEECFSCVPRWLATKNKSLIHSMKVAIKYSKKPDKIARWASYVWVFNNLKTPYILKDEFGGETLVCKDMIADYYKKHFGQSMKGTVE